MRYEFDTEVAKTLTIAQLMAEETVLGEVLEYIRLLRSRRVEVAVERERKKRGLWVDKRVTARRTG